MDSYSAKYSDANSSVDIVIRNDGATLWTTIRSIEFSGSDFDSLAPSDDTTPEQLQSFSLNRGELCSCMIECDIPVPIFDNGRELSGTLTIKLTLGDPAPNGGIDRELLLIVLTFNGQHVSGSGKSGWFEDELLEIQKQLPDGTYMRACINCLYSDYSPYGHGLFGQMTCFRNLKQAYLKVTSKDEFWAVHGQQERFVQETYLCADFQRRIAGTGYRG